MNRRTIVITTWMKEQHSLNKCKLHNWSFCDGFLWKTRHKELSHHILWIKSSEEPRAELTEDVSFTKFNWFPYFILNPGCKQVENRKTCPGMFSPQKSTVFSVETWDVAHSCRVEFLIWTRHHTESAHFQALSLGTRGRIWILQLIPVLPPSLALDPSEKKGCSLTSSFILHSCCLLLLLEWHMPLPPAAGGLIWLNARTDALFCFPLASPNNFASLFCTLAMNVIEMPIST